MMLFIDGTKQNSTNSYIAATVSQQASTTIGSWQNVSSRHFNGLIDDVRFSDSALYTSNFSTNCFGLTALNSSLALYNFNDNLSLLILKDSTINNNNGIIHGATYRIDDICGVTFLGNVLNFDGVNDYVDLGSNAGTGVRTIELWFNPSFVINRRINHFKTLIARNNHTSNANEFNITFSPVTATPSSASGSLRFAIYDGNLTSTTTYSIYSNSKVWNANQWYHLAAVVHPIQGMMLFIDGVKQNSTNPYSFATVFQQASTTIGSWQNAPTRYFSGLIDDVRFSDSALYTSSFSTSCPDSKASSSTIALFNFNDSSNVLITIDSSGNMNNGIIYGARVSKDLICPTITDITKSRKGANFLNVYPNPFYNQLHFEIETTYNSTYAVKIFNINCKAIIQIDNYESRQSINVSHLSKGLYFYVVTSGQNFVKSGKLIKN